MAYIGSTPVVGAFKKLDDISSSFDGVTQSFALTSDGQPLTISSSTSFIISLNGVLQEPGVSYSVNASTIIFADPPEALSSFFGVQMGSTGSVLVPTDDSVSASKIQLAAVTEAKIAANAVTTTKIADNAVTAAKIADGAITTTKIADSSVTTAKLSSNLIFNGVTTFLGGSIEKANIVASGASSNITINNQDSSVVYFTDNTIGNITITVNFTGLSSVATGNVSSYALLLTNNNSVRGYVFRTQVDGAAANVLRWQTEAPTSGSANIESYSFSVIKTDSSSYTVLAAKSNFV